MNLHRRSIFQTLLLLLLIGPLEAQQLFVCEMMGTTFLNDCCCEEHKNCADANCSDAITTESNTCCEVSIELNTNHEAYDELTVIKSVEVRSNVDPPPVIIYAVKQLAEPVCIIATRDEYSSLPYKLGTNTYLTTQRLRI